MLKGGRGAVRVADLWIYTDIYWIYTAYTCHGPSDVEPYGGPRVPLGTGAAEQLPPPLCPEGDTRRTRFYALSSNQLFISYANRIETT